MLPFDHSVFCLAFSPGENCLARQRDMNSLISINLSQEYLTLICHSRYLTPHPIIYHEIIVSADDGIVVNHCVKPSGTLPNKSNWD